MKYSNHLTWLAALIFGLTACSGDAGENLPEEVQPDAGGAETDADSQSDMGTEPPPEGGARVVNAFGALELAAGEELTTCVQWSLENEQSLYVNKVTLTNGGGYHHSNWFVVPEDVAPGEDGYFDCAERRFTEIGAATSGTVLFAQSTQSRVEEQDLPDGVVIKIPPNHKVVGSLHLLNVQTQPRETPLDMALDIIHPRDVEVVAAPFRLTYYNLEIEPNQETRFRSTCNFRSTYENATGEELDLKLYYVLPHYHELGNYFALRLSGGPNDGEEVFKLEGFNAEANGQAFDPPIDFSENGADGVTFECGYNNPRDEMVGWGIGDQEMCVMLGLADSKLLMDMSVMRGSENEIVDETPGMTTKSSGCLVLPLAKNESQTMPAEDELADELYVPGSDEMTGGEITPECEDFTGGVDPLAEPTIENVQRDLFQPGCTFSSCHDAENPAFGLDLASPDVRERLLNHELMTDAEMPLITPGDPEQSWLWRVTSECEPEANGTVMAKMPRNAPTLAPDNTLVMLRDWIAAGAN